MREEILKRNITKGTTDSSILQDELNLMGMTKTQHDAIKTFSHAIVQPTKEDQASLPHNTCRPSSLTFEALFNMIYNMICDIYIWYIT